MKVVLIHIINLFKLDNEVNFNLSNVGKVGGTMTKKLVEMGEKQLVKDTDTFNPS